MSLQNKQERFYVAYVYMYCSHKQFIDIAKATGVAEADLYDMLSVVATLSQHRGSLLKSTKVQDSIAKASSEVAHMIDLLARLDKLDATSLQSLLVVLKSTTSHHFTVRAKKTSDAIHETLEKQFGSADVEVVATEEIALQVAGDGRWYKRSLEKDLDKMLG